MTSRVLPLLLVVPNLLVAAFATTWTEGYSDLGGVAFALTTVCLLATGGIAAAMAGLASEVRPSGQSGYGIGGLALLVAAGLACAAAASAGGLPYSDSWANLILITALLTGGMAAASRDSLAVFGIGLVLFLSIVGFAPLLDL